MILLPGGAKIKLDRYLPTKACSNCGHYLPADNFLSTWRFNRDGAKELSFGSRCLSCNSKCDEFPSDLRGARFTSTFVDDDGRVRGWWQRSKNGVFGSEISLTLLRIRLVKGTYIPQPRINCSDPIDIVIEKDKSRSYPSIVKDDRRGFTKDQIFKATVRQHNVCLICDQIFTELNPAIGGHLRPHSKGYSTTDENCIAVHASCNLLQSDKSLEYARKRYSEITSPSFLDFM